jgi:Xaa-Pro dipeptidase
MIDARSLKTKIRAIQKSIRDEKIDGWLLYDFRGSNPFASNILGIPAHLHRTRRLFYFIPARGTPKKLVHAIESGNLDHLPGKKRTYAGWRSLETELGRLLLSAESVAMEYTPRNAIPYISVVDAGTIEMVRQQKVKIVSSANLVQRFEAVWTPRQFRANRAVARVCLETMHEAFRYIGRSIKNGKRISEYDVQQYIMNVFEGHGYVSGHPVNCSVNANSADPHYEPTVNRNEQINIGDFVLIDLWAKANDKDGVYSDITWTGYVGDRVPGKYENVFGVVRDARDAAFAFVSESFRKRKSIRGCDVDDVARGVIAQHGYEKYFVHRTGHSIGREMHANGANMDNYETKDIREIIPETSFTIEPGIYIPGKFGVRSEIDVFIMKNRRAIITAGPPQTDVLPILRNM